LIDVYKEFIVASSGTVDIIDGEVVIKADKIINKLAGT